jgi:hypothetical protein
MAGVSRQILWFVLAYTLVIIVHEGAHAVIARASGLEATMFHFWVNIDAADRATAGQRAAFGLAGPVSSLLAGLAAWIAYRSVHRSAAALPLLYLAAFGVSNFFGNMMSTAFLGDFSNVAVWLGLPMTMRYTLSAIGGVVAASTLFLTGRELARWRSPWAGRTFAVFAGIVLPVVVGTLLIILLNQPRADSRVRGGTRGRVRAVGVCRRGSADRQRQRVRYRPSPSRALRGRRDRAGGGRRGPNDDHRHFTVMHPASGYQSRSYWTNLPGFDSAMMVS